MPYTYSKTNELENPEYYMYSQYGGKKFLEEYISDRKHFLKLISKKIYQDTGIETQKLYADFKSPTRAVLKIMNQFQSGFHLSNQSELENLYSSWKNRETISRNSQNLS